LGDQLDETLDEFNDETFGASGADVGMLFHWRIAGKLTLGRDFDFFGKTAKVANVMEEEHQTYARSHIKYPPPTQLPRQAEIPQKKVRVQQQQTKPPVWNVSS
jgi:DNA topoisomerase 2-associated protein PAT1